METYSDRIERILVLLLLNTMKGMSVKEKAMQLNVAGLSNIEIAEYLQTSPQVIATVIYQSRKGKKTKKSK